MRDEDRLREKIQVSLEDRHVALLAVCALVLLGGVFALGLLVGKQLAGSLPQAPQAGDLAALDAQAQAQAQAQPPPRAAPRPAPAKPEPKADPKPTAASLAAADADEDPVPESGKPPEEAPPPKQQRAPVEIAAAPAAVALAPPPRAVQITRPVQLTPAPASVGDYTVQIGASQDKADAQRLEARARAAGLKPYVVEANLGEKGTWYRIRVGAFSSKDAANKFRLDVERELRQGAVVMSTR